jgi:hypothetical protein
MTTCLLSHAFGIRRGRMIVSSLSHIDLRQCESGARFRRMNRKKRVKIGRQRWLRS